jgi:hypothetical protein
LLRCRESTRRANFDQSAARQLIGGLGQIMTNFSQQVTRTVGFRHISRDEAFLIAVNIAKLPSVPRQILKDIPWPPNSASRDD